MQVDGVHWPDIGSTAGQLLRDMLSGHDIWINNDAPADLEVQFIANITLLRCLGWPVVAMHPPAANAIGLAYTLPERTRQAAIQQIHQQGST